MSDNGSTISDSSKKRGRPKKPVGRITKVEQLKQLQSQNRRILRSDKPSSLLSSQIATTVTPIKNKFNVLNNDVDTSSMDTSQSTPTQQTVEGKKPYIPPVVIQGMKFNDLIVVLKEYNITNYKIKLISVGIKVTLPDIESNIKLKKNLSDKKIEYFTFSNRETNPFKVILTGLPVFTTEELKAELIYCGIDTESILEVLPLQHKEQRSYNVHKNVNYLIKFDRLKVNLQVVNKIKSLFSIIVRWYPYVNNRSGPTQCRRCQMYGHGTSHCSRVERCLKCGGNHSADDCLMTEIKCANCGKEHEANSKACDNRIKYVAIRENISINRQLMQMGQKPNSVNFEINKKAENVTNNDSNFPAIRKRNTTDHQNFYKHFSTSQPVSGSSRMQSTQSSFSRSQPAPSMPKVFEGNVRNAESNLFSFEELTSLISEVTQQISRCTTRQQQFEVIMKLSLQYLGQLSPSSF